MPVDLLYCTVDKQAKQQEKKYLSTSKSVRLGKTVCIAVGAASEPLTAKQRRTFIWVSVVSGHIL